MSGLYRKDLLVTLSAAFALIVYEVFLSRFFSVVMEYSFVSLAISLATLGIGLGGVCAYRYAEWIYGRRYEYLGFFSFSILVSVFVMYGLNYQGLWFYAFMSLIPFWIGGLLLASIIQEQGEHVRSLYLADLAGAGAGAAASIPLMNVFGPVQTISLLSVILFVFSLLLVLRTRGRIYQAIACTVMGVLAYNAVLPFSMWVPFRAFLSSPSNVMASKSGVKPVFSQWDAYARTDVYDAGDGELLYITIDGGAVSPISKFDGDLKQLDYLRSTTGFLAFQGGGKENVLIIGAGGGQDALAARIAGYEHIEAIDINSGSFNAVQKLAAFSGNPYSLPQLKQVVTDGRSYVRQTSHQYDLIFLPLVKKESENGMALALTENYIFTQEAIGEYFSKLKPNGRLAFLLHEENELAKVMTAAGNALKADGVTKGQLNNHMAVISTYQHLGHIVYGMNGSQITRPLLLISKEPFTLQFAKELNESARFIGQIPVHVPFSYDRYSLLSKMISRSENGISANRDDMPFFYKQSDGVPNFLVWALVMIIVITLFLARTTKYPQGHTIYFSGIAVGFMILETTMVQRLVLPLAHPSLSFVVVLGTLLTAGGIGSYYSEKFNFGKMKKRFAPLILIAVYGTFVNVAITVWGGQVFQLAIVYRTAMVILMLAPLGFFMGMAFPYGISRITERHRALSWAINGIMTVAGSLITVILSLTMGFTATMAAGAVIYALLYFLQPALGFDKFK